MVKIYDDVFHLMWANWILLNAGTDAATKITLPALPVVRLNVKSTHRTGTSTRRLAMRTVQPAQAHLTGIYAASRLAVNFCTLKMWGLKVDVDTMIIKRQLR